jgi:hypothetical protein
MILFQTFVAKILLLEPLPPINKVFSLVLQEERQKGLSGGIPQSSIFGDSSALLTTKSPTINTQTVKQGSRKPKPVCSHCGVTGHTIEKCYKIHGFPPGFKFTRNKSAGTSSSANQVQLTESSPLPFTQSQVQQLMTFMQNMQANSSASALQVGGVSNTTSNCLNSSNEGIPYSVFHHTSVFSNPKYSVFSSCHTSILPQPHTWIIDTGATDHMINSISLFTSITATISSKVKLPNGKFALVTHIGTVKISAHLILTNVLCVPSFSFNLLSVSKLVQSFKFCFIFFANYCFIQNLTSWMTIGVGREANGLYYLLDDPAVPASDVFSSSFSNSVHFPISAHVKSVATDLWHYRMGHLSHSRLKLLHSNNPQIACDLLDTPCTVCPLARQKRLSFPHSVSCSSSIFALVHCDIWGPFSVGSRNGHHYFLTIVDDYSRFTWIHLLQSKDQTRTYLKSFFHFVENQFDSKIKILRSDNGPEFHMPDFYSLKGVLHQLSCVESPNKMLLLKGNTNIFSMLLVLLNFNLIFLSNFGEIVS